MTNEQLAIVAREDQSALVELWGQTCKFVRLKAQARMDSLNGLGGVDIDDLMQAGFIALVSAAHSFECGAGAGFLSWLSLHLKTEFAEAAGGRTKRQMLDPLRRYTSLDAMVADSDDLYWMDVIPDPAAEREIDAVAERDFDRRRKHAIADALGTLDEESQDVIRLRYYVDLNAIQTAHRLGLNPGKVRSIEQKALMKLRHPSRSGRLIEYLQ